MALDRSKRPPRSVARQATFLGETEPRAARPMGASLRVRQLGAIRKACQRNPSPRFVPMPIGPAAGGNDPALAKRGKAFLTSDARMGILSHMLNHGYLAQTLRRPLPTKDGGTLRTVADAANYIVALPKDRRRSHWDRTVQLLLDMADPSDISRQLELALFYDRQLNFKTPTST